ncbi:hypothetical protein KJ596_01985 [Patescibacteria group bacterium]|nr:hypothetical protein [Patescibacteria group bacterium]MBU1867995.1 hypothetical protein [Patescibacteria group bacterium]
MQVRKRDGSLEEFDRNKIKGGLVAAGVEEAEAEEITVELGSWATSTALENAVETQAIWEKACEVLDGYNPDIATVYKTHRD